MPIEIKELVIRAEVVSRDSGSLKEGNSGLTSRERNLLIEECVDQVMKAIKRQKER